MVLLLDQPLETHSVTHLGYLLAPLLGRCSVTRMVREKELQ